LDCFTYFIDSSTHSERRAGIVLDSFCRAAISLPSAVISSHLLDEDGTKYSEQFHWLAFRTASGETIFQ